MADKKKPRGRPKIPWDPYYGNELQKRLEAGLSLPTVEQEAAELEKWGQTIELPKIGTKETKPLQTAAIRQRINKRHNGAAGYKEVRAFHRHKLGLTTEV